jgi:hypothetical protein
MKTAMGVTALAVMLSAAASSAGVLEPWLVTAYKGGGEYEVEFWVMTWSQSGEQEYGVADLGWSILTMGTGNAVPQQHYDTPPPPLPPSPSGKVEHTWGSYSANWLLIDTGSWADADSDGDVDTTNMAIGCPASAYGSQYYGVSDGSGTAFLVDTVVYEVSGTDTLYVVIDPASRQIFWNGKDWDARPFAAVPEPATCGLLAVGGLALLRGKRRFGG